MMDNQQRPAVKRFWNRSGRSLVRSAESERTSDGPDCRREAQHPDVARLLPVLARAMDLGRGPPALILWLRERLQRIRASSAEPDAFACTSVLNRLANDVADLLDRPQPAMFPTQRDRQTLSPVCSETVVVNSVSDPEANRPPAATNEQPASAQQPSFAKETILLTEDEPAVRALVRHILHRDGYIVLEARNGREALQLADAHSGAIDLLVTDVIMPEMGGSRLAELLTARRPEIKVLFLSGDTEDAVARHGARAESAFLQKPFSPKTLLETVRKILDR